jgi:hypothetical protein
MRLINDTLRARVPMRRCILALGIALGYLLAATSLQAQSTRGVADVTPEDAQRITSVWTNVFYGPNSTGAGVGIRCSFLGVGVSEFAFVGDSARSLPARPGGNFLTVDAYLVVDITSWLGTYGSFGWAGRFSNYHGTTVSDIEQEIDGFSAGGGITVALRDRFVMGVGYSGIFMPIKGEGPEYDPINRVVVQLGYQY